MLIGFTHNTSAVWPRFFCRIFRHAAVVIDGVLIQVASDGARCFPVGPREIRLLENAGWVFVRVPPAPLAGRALRGPAKLGRWHFQLLTCVGFAKRAAGIRAPFVWTPDGLFRFLTKPKTARKTVIPA